MPASTDHPNTFILPPCVQRMTTADRREEAKFRRVYETYECERVRGLRNTELLSQTLEWRHTSDGRDTPQSQSTQTYRTLKRLLASRLHDWLTLDTRPPLPCSYTKTTRIAGHGPHSDPLVYPDDVFNYDHAQVLYLGDMVRGHLPQISNVKLLAWTIAASDADNLPEVGSYKRLVHVALLEELYHRLACWLLLDGSDAEGVS